MKRYIGDAEWETQNGYISPIERWRYALAAVKSGMVMLGRSAVFRGNRAVQLHRIDLDKIVFPDSSFAKKAIEKMESASTPSLINHCYRSYIWGSLLGQKDGKQWEPELLFVSAMLHDLGLTECFHGTCSHAQCFTLDSIAASAEVLSNTTQERAAVVSRAILAHLNVKVSGDELGWEAHYLQAGTSFDIIGARFKELPKGSIRAAIEKYPRLHLKKEITAWADKESKLRPHSRFALLNKVGFSMFINAAPFES